MNRPIEHRAWRWAGSRLLVVAILLLAWALRICCLEEVPPGWRDDELINIHALSGEVLAGRYPLYFAGASGHEPLYHYAHAAVHAILGFNVLSGQLLSAALGTLSVALAYVVARRLVGPAAGAISSLMISVSFWSLMYSRVALRHVSLLPFALAFIYWYWRSSLDPAGGGEPGWPGLTSRRVVVLGVVLGLSLYTYPGSRLLFVLPILLLVYQALAHRRRLARQWRGTLMVLVIATALAVPMGIDIVAGFSSEAAQGIGSEGRMLELAVPIRELLAGNPGPLVDGIWTTLGMFHATGDPEWLYNIAGRPVLGLAGGFLLWIGVVRCLVRWREPLRALLLAWLALGLLPAFITIPPASLGHTILAMPVVYMLVADTLLWLLRKAISLGSNLHRKQLRSAAVGAVCLGGTVLVLAGGARDLRDYFFEWPDQGMVGILYRADFREASFYLNDNPEIADVAVTSALWGPWDRIAVEVDIDRDDVAVRLFNPDRALLWIGGQETTTVLMTSWPDADPPITDLLSEYGLDETVVSAGLSAARLRALDYSENTPEQPLARFANGLTLVDLYWLGESPRPGQDGLLLCIWVVESALQLPPIPIVANPPPPGIYSGPRLSVFTHLIDQDGTLVSGDDGLWVDPVTLRPGDIFAQAHRLSHPGDASEGEHRLEIGLYDPKTGERLAVLESGIANGATRVVVSSTGLERVP